MYATISLIASLDVKGVFVIELMFILIIMELGDNKQFPLSTEERDPRLSAF